MELQNSLFMNVRGTTERTLKMAEAQITSSGLKSRLHRQHEPVKCGKHLKDTIEQLKRLTELFLGIQAPLENSGLYTQFIEYRDKFSTSLTKLLNQFESHLSTGSKNFDMEIISKYTSFFYHMAEEIKFLFPSGKFATNQVFGRKDAQNWWERNFNSRVAVASAEFLARFRNEFPDVNEDGDALIDTMGFSSLDYISKYDLDLFTRLFGAWPFVTRIWRRLVNHPGYQKYGTFNTTFDVLNRCRTTPGSYTFRISMSRNGYWSIGYVSAEGKITQVLCFTSPMTDYLCSGKEQGCFKYPKGQACSDDLSDVSNMRTKVKLYSHPGAAEDLLKCKICGTNPNDAQLEPCGHFICVHCCRKIQSSASCYQCNSKILCTTPIEIKHEMANAESSQQRDDKGDQFHFKNFGGANKPTAGGRGNQNLLQAAERVAAACGRDQDAIEVDLRILYEEGFGLDQVADALIAAGGDRAKAKELLQKPTFFVQVQHLPLGAFLGVGIKTYCRQPKGSRLPVVVIKTR
ncbi:expressed protein [Echinococcus multilocularis]|uniref:E3 ubiquitin-protein ligase CBL n=1 Tax=Echinococcus multilocularis TaxID=6211 RepID=A0A068YJL3_ECHMU|nr:expressed protein [Echinococcus multilocularis]